MNDWHKYKGYQIHLLPEFLSTEERLARKEWRAIIKSWRYSVRYGGKLSFEAKDFTSKEQALQDAENTIDAILDSL